MKLWYVSKYAKTPSTGLPTRQFFLCKSLAKYGVNTTLILSRSNGCRYDWFWGLKKLEESHGVSCVLLNGPVVTLGLTLKRVLTWILFEINFWIYCLSVKKRDYPDILVASSLSLLTFITATFAKRRFKCKLILEIRDIWPQSLIEMTSLSENNIAIKVLRFVELHGYKNADAFVSTLPRFDNYLRTRLVFDFKFLYIPQGFDNEFISFDVDARFKDIFSKDSFNICYAGSIGRFNNVGILLEVAKLLTDSNIKLIIIGRGPLKASLVDQSRYLGNLFFFEFIPKKYLISVISKADLLIFPSKYFPVFQYGVSPNKWIDYMLSGRPILDTHIPNRPDYESILNEAKCAFIEETDSAEVLATRIISISKMPTEILNRIGQNGRKFALEKLDYNILGEKFLSFIQSVVGK
jgi:glycosyltransferase involved in cell wall biosynthesis